MSKRLQAGSIELKRAHEAPARKDGARVVADGPWSRGGRRKEAALDHRDVNRDSEHRNLGELLAAVRNRRACEKILPLGPRPVLRAAETARVLVVGQAPGLRVHTTGIAWDDASGVRLRSWMGLDATAFYDESRGAIIPMGFCYPGRGNGGDLPPRPECAALWLDRLTRHP